MLVRNEVSTVRRNLDVSAMQDDEIDLMALFGTLWRGKWRIAFFALLGLILAGAYATQVAVPQYRSSTVLAIEENEPTLVDIQSVVSGVSADSEAINTEIEVIRSRSLLEKVVTELSLLDDQEFNETLTPPSLISVETIKDALGATSAPPTETAILNDAVKKLLGKTNVSAKRQTYAITIGVTTGDPEKSAQIANTIAELYRQDQVQVKFDTLDEGVSWLSARVVELEAEIQERDAALKEATAAADYINVEGLEVMNRQVRDLGERLLGEQQDAESAAANFALLNSAVEARSLDLVLEATQDPTLRRLAASGQDEDTLWAAGSPFMARVDLLVSRARTDVDRANTQVASLQDTVTALEERVDAQAVKLGEIQQMNRELETVSVLYETFLTRLKETTIQQGVQSPDARVLSKAITGVKVAPRTTIIGTLGLILGAMVGAGLVLLREMRSDTFRNAEELEAITGEQVIGQVPLFPISARVDLLQYLQDKPTSAAVESIRNLRTSLLLSRLDEPPKVIMSTSTLPAEGKTTQSISLAHNLSGLGKKVLLIEGDIRRRTLDEYFKQKAGKDGLLSVVAGEATLEDTVVFHERLNADVLVGQKSSENAADFFASDKFKAFMETVREVYDFVIIDTPPVLVVPDARVIGQHCDAIMYSVKWDSTAKPQVRAALNQLKSVNLKVSGLVLSQIDANGMKRYGYGDYGGSYAAYSSGYYDD